LGEQAKAEPAGALTPNGLLTKGACTPMADQHSDGTSDDLAVTTVLTQDPAMVREMAYARIELDAADLWRMFQQESGNAIYGGTIRKNQENLIRAYIDELNELVDLLGQVGWRKRKGE
jgi:hypothetical protein